MKFWKILVIGGEHVANVIKKEGKDIEDTSSSIEVDVSHTLSLKEGIREIIEERNIDIVVADGYDPEIDPTRGWLKRKIQESGFIGDIDIITIGGGEEIKTEDLRGLLRRRILDSA